LRKKCEMNFHCYSNKYQFWFTKTLAFSMSCNLWKSLKTGFINPAPTFVQIWFFWRSIYKWRHIVMLWYTKLGTKAHLSSRHIKIYPTLPSLSHLGSHHTRHFCKQYWDKKILRCLRHRFQCPTKLSSKKHNHLFVKSLPWLVIETYVSNIAVSFYRNIVCKNVFCEVDLLMAPYRKSFCLNFPISWSSKILKAKSRNCLKLQNSSRLWKS